jgi:hypothetical protein
MKVVNILVLSLIGAMSSCSVMMPVVVKSHEQVMNEFKGADEGIIIEKFGMPTSKKTDAGYVEWYYEFSKSAVTGFNAMNQSQTNSAAIAGSTTNAAGAAVGGPGYALGRMGSTTSAGAAGVTNSAGAVSGGMVTSEVTQYVKFIFKDGKVVSWNSNGVNYQLTEMKKVPLSSALGY